MFGGMFDGKVSPPMGAWVALKFASLIDPAIAYDVYADRPWVLSPVFCSMNIVDVRDAQYSWKELEEKFGSTSVVDQVTSLKNSSRSEGALNGSDNGLLKSKAKSSDPVSPLLSTANPLTR
ncbi:hypothetical protein HDU93_006439, partial [Gonapodya sp. JEL0774]